MDRAGHVERKGNQNWHESRHKSQKIELENRTNNGESNIPMGSMEEGTNGACSLEDGCEEPFVKKHHNKLSGAKKELFQHVIVFFILNYRFLLLLYVYLLTEPYLILQ